MFQIITGIGIAFLALLGVSELIRGGLQIFLAPPAERVTYMVRVRGGDEKVEYIVRALAFTARERRTKSTPAIILIDDNMDEQTRRICDVLAGELGCVSVCKSHELSDLIHTEA
ncbi:MAG TPA: hypothetical protein DEP42_03790 [Ruminococcaceae bacterium]|nr:hypothetical protein [Oscillospiraceae bacterium]